MTVEYDTNKVTLAVSCLICGEHVPIEHMYETIKICDKCREAVMKMREMIEKKEKSNND